MSDDRPLVFEVQMPDELGNPARYRVLRNAPARLLFESFRKGFAVSDLNDATGERWIEIQSDQTRDVLTYLGELSGLLVDAPQVKWGHERVARMHSALFVAPKLAPCGSCGGWNPIEAAACGDCGKDPRVIAEPCPECDGRGETHPYTTRDPITCPLCDGLKVVETPTGKARFRYLRRCVEAGIITEQEAGAAFIEE